MRITESVHGHSNFCRNDPAMNSPTVDPAETLRLDVGTASRETGVNSVKTKLLTSQTPRQPLQNYPSGHLGGWATPWSAEEMLDGQRQRADITAYDGPAHDGLPQKRPEELNRPACPTDEPIGQGTELI